MIGLARRTTLQINHKPARNLHHAVTTAEALKRPLNLFVTLNFGCMGCSLQKSPHVFEQVRRNFGRWIRRQQLQATYVWVLERPRGRSYLDAHWLLHLPDSRITAFEKILDRWLQRLTGGFADNRSVKIQSAPTPRGAVKYLLKGMNPSLADYFHIRWESQSEIEGPRCGFTRNIGPTQRYKLIALGKHPKPRQWKRFLYQRPLSAPSESLAAQRGSAFRDDRGASVL